MKIAVAYENGLVFQHFGHTQQFMVYETENGQVQSSALLPSGGSGHGALAGLLGQAGVQALICGGIGGGARAALAQAGIAVYGGVSGSADAAVLALLAGTLAFDPNAACSHHQDGHDHACGGHGEGHTCGGHGEGHTCGGHGEGHDCH